MQSSKVLEMLNQNRIEELKSVLEDELFTDSLKHKPNAKKRYAAMKKYLSYIIGAREILQKPCPVEVDGKNYISFCNSYSLALTTEDCGCLALCDEPNRYPPVGKLVRFDGHEDKIDFNKVIAEAKSKGYKLKKNEIMSNNYLMHYDGAYFRIALVDSTFGIINDGGVATVYHESGPRRALTITNNIGVCVIMPVFIDGGTENSIVIEVNDI